MRGGARPLSVAPVWDGLWVQLRNGMNVPSQAAVADAVSAGGDTIFALASGGVRAGVAVIRLSGPKADEALATLSRKPLPAVRKAVVRTLFGTSGDERLDDALVLRFAGPNSYSGENLVELQVHGGRAVIDGVLAALSALPGLRLAEPGEFTRRAVENGRLDLTQAEAVNDLIAAETEAQRRQALRQLGGALGALYENWRSDGIRAAAWLEAVIDFADEDIPESALATARAALIGLAKSIAEHLDDKRRGEILRDGMRVAILGAPNAGKSSLLNALAKRDVAIVSDIAGTTRDVIEVKLDIGGYPVVVADTAGLRETNDRIESEGVRRAMRRAEEADLRLLLCDGAKSDSEAPKLPGDAPTMTICTKGDIATKRAHQGLWISTVTGEGMNVLVTELGEHAKRMMDTREAPTVTRARHRDALREAANAFERAARTEQADLAAEEARVALRALGRITGRVDIDNLLDVVFRDFCIGK